MFSPQVIRLPLWAASRTPCSYSASKRSQASSGSPEMPKAKMTAGARAAKSSTAQSMTSRAARGSMSGTGVVWRCSPAWQ